jgi:hypothetical protein
MTPCPLQMPGALVGLPGWERAGDEKGARARRPVAVVIQRGGPPSVRRQRVPPADGDR